MFVRLRKAFQRQDWLAYFIELLLIVLGITIAYELNVYQQREVLEEAKYSLLGNLYNENKRNYEELEKTAQHFKSLPDRLEYLIELLQDEASIIDSVQQHLYITYSWTYYTLHTGYLNNYISSNTKTNHLLDSALLQLQYDYRELTVSSDLAKDYRLDHVSPFLVDKLTYFEDSISNQALDALKDKAFLNRVVILSAIETEHLRVYQNALNQIKTVDSLIADQLHH